MLQWYEKHRRLCDAVLVVVGYTAIYGLMFLLMVKLITIHFI